MLPTQNSVASRAASYTKPHSAFMTTPTAAAALLVIFISCQKSGAKWANATAVAD